MGAELHQLLAVLTRYAKHAKVDVTLDHLSRFISKSGTEGAVLGPTKVRNMGKIDAPKEKLWV
jgi:hypothetical protein